MSAWLKRHAARVLCASNGQEALKVLAENRVDAIVSDVRMPIMDGVALVRAVAASERYRPRVIFVTGFADLSARDAYGLGVEAIIEKPLERDHLLRAVKHSLIQRNELWSRPPEFVPGTVVQAKLTSLADTPGEERIAFGRGGFCLRTPQRLREEPVRFELEFQAEHVFVSGEGIVRWRDAAQGLVGVEIVHVDDNSRGWVAEPAENRKLEAYIPRTPSRHSARGTRHSAPEDLIRDKGVEPLAHADEQLNADD